MPDDGDPLRVHRGAPVPDTGARDPAPADFEAVTGLPSSVLVDTSRARRLTPSSIWDPPSPVIRGGGIRSCDDGTSEWSTEYQMEVCRATE